MGKIEFTVNGQSVCIDQISPTTTLLEFLRGQLGMTGTKEGCAEGDCGACTVAVMSPEQDRYQSVNSCLVLLPMMQGKEVLTVEGLKQEGQHHPVQESLVQSLGSQCGYCTPGVVMSMFEACYRTDLDEDWKIDDQMCGNLCRCTGYRPISEATHRIAGSRPSDKFSEDLKNASVNSMALEYEHDDQQYYNPASLEELWLLLAKHPEAKLICGGTDVSLAVTKRFEHLPLLISVEGISSLKKFEEQDDHFEIGASLDLAELETLAAEKLVPLSRMLRFFGSRQIKNRASVGGNLCNASPIGDLAPILIALGSEVVLASKAGERRLTLDSFFLDYRKTALKPGEILKSVCVPKIPKTARAVAYKVSKRQELDISTVAAGLYIEIDAGRVTDARFAYGGMAATPARARKAEAAVIGQAWNASTIELAVQAIEEDFQPIDDHRGSAWYRRTVAKNLLRGFQIESDQACPGALGNRPTATIQIGVSS